MSSRKRKRSQLEESDLEEYEQTEGQSETKTKDQAEKEQEVWDVVREERFEIVEQLPLTLDRQLSLMRQLDEQSQNYVSNLLPMIYKYISLRRNLGQSTQNETSGSASSTDESISQNAAEVSTFDSRQFTSTKTNGVAKLDPRTTTANGTPSMPVPLERVKTPETSREHLSHIAWLSEELLRASQEKVNLAQATLDSVDRHIRLLDVAIQEQEGALAASVEGSIHLPDLTLPKPARAASNAVELNSMTLQIHGPLNEPIDEESGQPIEEEGGLRPLLKNVLLTPTKNEAGEDLYCYCNRPSFGEMIACDGPHCHLEWFHYGCVGVTETPAGEWFCENCTPFDL